MYGEIENFAMSHPSPQPNISLETIDDAINYIAGYIVKRFKNSHPQLGEYPYKTAVYNLPSCVQQLSFGCLTKPTPQFLSTVKRWNLYFEKFDKKKPFVVKNLAPFTRINA